MFKTASFEKRERGLRTGLRSLDRLLQIGSGIITLRSPSAQWLSHLASSMIVRNHQPGSESLYMHWVDYHKRFWTVDFDRMSRLAKRLNADVNSIMDSVYFVRMFSRDCTEVEENWNRIYEFGDRGMNLVVLDSVSELYEMKGKGKNWRGSARGRTYSINRFVKLCMMNDCPGIILDSSRKPIHPYLGEVSSIILDFFFRDRVLVNVIKHPCMINSAVELTRNPDPSLKRWLS